MTEERLTHVELKRKLSRGLRQTLVARGWSQSELARRCDVHPTYINQLCTGQRLPDLCNFLFIVKKLEVSAEALLEPTKETGYPEAVINVLLDQLESTVGLVGELRKCKR